MIEVNKGCMQKMYKCLFQEYFRLRSKAVSVLKEENDTPYPHKFHVEMSLTDYIEKYHTTEPGAVIESVETTVAGE